MTKLLVDDFGFAPLNNDWLLVTSVQDFERYISMHGIPDVISFGMDGHGSERMGVDCIKMLIQTLIINKSVNTDNWPECNVHFEGSLDIDKMLETWSFPKYKGDI